MDKPIIGQEVICPDGLGRVVNFNFESPQKEITVSTYVHDRCCTWSADNVSLIPISYSHDDLHDDLQTIISQLDNLFSFLRNN